MGSEQRSGKGGFFVLVGDSREDGPGRVTLLPLAGGVDKSVAPHEPSADARAEIGAYHRWAAKATTGGRAFRMEHASPDDFPQGVPAGIEFVDWVWLGFGGDDLVKAYEPWWPRDSRGKWIKRGSFAGLEDKIRRLHDKRMAERDRLDARISEHGDKLRAAEGRALSGDRAAQVEASTHRARIAELRSQRDQVEQRRKGSAADVLAEHEAEQRAAERANRATVGGMTTTVQSGSELAQHEADRAERVRRTRAAFEAAQSAESESYRSMRAKYGQNAAKWPTSYDGTPDAIAHSEAVKARDDANRDFQNALGLSREHAAAIAAHEPKIAAFMEAAKEKGWPVSVQAILPSGEEGEHFKPPLIMKMRDDSGDVHQYIFHSKPNGYTYDSGVVRGQGVSYKKARESLGISDVPAPRRVTPTRATVPPAHVQAVRDAYDQVLPDSEWGRYVPLADLREAAPELSREQFDAAVKHLARTDRSVGLVPFDRPLFDGRQLTDRQREASIPFGGSTANALHIDAPDVLRPAAPAPSGTPADHVQAVREAYGHLATRPGAYVRIADIRDRLPSMSRAEQDAALREIPNIPGHDILPWDNTKALDERDRAAAVQFGGTANHAMHIEPPDALGLPSGANVDPFTPLGAPAPSGIDQVRAAHARAGGEHVSLSDMRTQLAAGGMTDRAAQDEAIRMAGRQPDIHLVTPGNPKGLTPADHAAALRVGGQDVHYVRIASESAPSMTEPRVSGPPADVVDAKLRGVNSRDEARAYLDGLGLKAPELRRLARDLGVSPPSGASKLKTRDLIVEILAGRRLDGDAIRRIAAGEKAAAPDPKAPAPQAGAPQPPVDDRWPGWAVDLAIATAGAAALTAALTRGLDIRAVVRAAAERWPDSVPSAAEVVGWLGAQYGDQLAAALTPAVGDVLAEGYLVGARSATAILDAGIDAREPGGITLAVDWSHWRPGDARAARQILSADGRTVGLQKLLDEAGVTIRGIAAQRLDELAVVLADGLERGESPATIATALRGIVANPSWAQTVAWTETARAQGAAASEVYRQRGVARNEWMTARDPRVCPICLANEAAGPVDVGTEFPSGDKYPPAHPRDRCALIPTLPEIGKAAGGNREQLHHYWTRGEGLAKWADSPHPWTALYHHLLKYLPDGEAKRTAANWFHDVKGYWPGDQKGKNPVGPG